PVSARALVESQRDAALSHRRVRAEVKTVVQKGIRAVDPGFESRHERPESAAVSNDDELAVFGLPKVPGVDRDGRRKALIIGASLQHFPRDSPPDLAARDRNDIAVPPLARADRL